MTAKTRSAKSGLSQNTIKKMKEGLLERREQILKDLKDITSERDMKAKFPEFGDKADENAQEITEYSTNLATEKVLEDALRDIEDALDRIKKGAYGICKYCRKQISEKRMLARPVASACIECKTKLQNS